MPDINITNSELNFDGDMVAGDKHVHLPPEPPREFVAPFQALADLQTFVGREDALQKLATLGVIGVTNPRFLIAGIGGLGKTTLAIHIAHQLRYVFSGGVLWADVPTTEPFSKLDEWARAYHGDVRELQDLNARADRVRDLIHQRVGNKRVLAILDGIVDENDDAKLAPLLRALSDCAVLVTSRARQLASFHNAHVIDLEHLSSDETIDLFARVTQHDKRLQNKNDVIIGIGKVVDFLPLALDIAAAQLRDNKSWALEHLLTLLRDERRRLDTLQWGDGKMRGIRASILVSYKRLTNDEQKFFDALGALAGEDFDVHAAFYVAVGKFETEAELRIKVETARKFLAKLHRLSLLQEGRRPERNKMHPLTRGFAREQLADQNAELRMAKFYQAIAQTYIRNVATSEIRRSMRIVDEELSNIRAGLKWAQTNQNQEGWELTRDYAVCLCRFFNLRASWRDQIEVSKDGISACDKLGDIQSKTDLRCYIGIAYGEIGLWKKGVEQLTIAISECSETKDEDGLARAYGNLANLYALMKDWENAIKSYHMALTKFEAENDFRAIGASYSNLGLVYTEIGQTALAQNAFIKSLNAYNNVDDTLGRATALSNYGRLCTQEGDFEQATEIFEAAIEFFSSIGAYDDLAEQYWNLAMLYRERKDLRKSLEFAGKAMEIWYKTESQQAHIHRVQLEQLRDQNENSYMINQRE